MVIPLEVGFMAFTETLDIRSVCPVANSSRTPASCIIHILPLYSIHSSAQLSQRQQFSLPTPPSAVKSPPYSLPTHPIQTQGSTPTYPNPHPQATPTALPIPQHLSRQSHQPPSPSSQPIFNPPSHPSSLPTQATQFTTHPPPLPHLALCNIPAAVSPSRNQRPAHALCRVRAAIARQGLGRCCDR